MGGMFSLWTASRFPSIRTPIGSNRSAVSTPRWWIKSWRMWWRISCPRSPRIIPTSRRNCAWRSALICKERSARKITTGKAAGFRLARFPSIHGYVENIYSHYSPCCKVQNSGAGEHYSTSRSKYSRELSVPLGRGAGQLLVLCFRKQSHIRLVLRIRYILRVNFVLSTGIAFNAIRVLVPSTSLIATLFTTQTVVRDEKI